MLEHETIESLRRSFGDAEATKIAIFLFANPESQIGEMFGNCIVRAGFSEQDVELVFFWLSFLPIWLQKCMAKAPAPNFGTFVIRFLCKLIDAVKYPLRTQSLADLKGITMAIHETVTQPAPQITFAPTPISKWQREFEAFQRLRPDLLRTHLGQFVVIHNGQVIDFGKDDLELALRFFARHGNVSVHIGLVTSEPELPVRFPHFRTSPMREST